MSKPHSFRSLQSERSLNRVKVRVLESSYHLWNHVRCVESVDTKSFARMIVSCCAVLCWVVGLLRCDEPWQSILYEQKPQHAKP